MNFDLGPDELALRDGIRELCSRRFPMDVVRKGFDREGWRVLGEAGVFSLRLSDEQGGAGLGMTEAVIVFQELGRALICGPLVGTHLAAGVVDGAAAGERVVTVQEHMDGLVAFGDEADAMLLVLSSGHVVLNESAECDPVSSLDPLTPMSRVTAAPSSDTSVDGTRFLLEGSALTAALSAGIAAKTTELAVAFAKEREQFGKPIGSFQAVKHMCADMLVRAEVARAAVDAAGVLLDDPTADATDAVHTAKLLASEYAVANAKACIQVHGGMGFTWEVDAHLYLKRAALLATQFGGLDEHAEAAAASL